MNDPIMIISSSHKSFGLPMVKYNAEEYSDLDVISLKINEVNKHRRSFAMIRLRNRSYKPVSMNNVLFTYTPEGEEESYIVFVGKMKYGYSGNETLKNLNYTQKVSEYYNVNDTHNVLEGYRDTFTTFEEKLIRDHQPDQAVTKKSHEILLKPREIAHLKLFVFKYKKDERHDTVLEEHFKKIHEEEIMQEKAYESNSTKKGAFRF